MPDLPIGGLPAGVPPDQADELAIVQGTPTKRVTVGDLVGPLLPGWDHALTAAGPASPAARDLLVLAPTTLAAASIGPQLIGTITVAANVGDVILIALHLGITATAAIAPTGILTVAVSSVNSDALRFLELWLPTMVSGQIVVADLVFPCVASGSPVVFDLTLGLAGTSDGAHLELQHYVFDSYFSATVLPAVSADAVDVLRYSGPISDGAGGFLVDGLGNYIVW